MRRTTRSLILLCVVLSPPLVVSCLDLSSLQSGEGDEGGLPDVAADMPAIEASSDDVVTERADASLPDVVIPTDPDARAALYKTRVLSRNPLAYWRFEESTGTLARDERGAFPGSYTNDVVLGQTDLFGGNGAIYLHDTAHVVVTNASALSLPSESFTLEVWVNPTMPYGATTSFMGTSTGVNLNDTGWALRTLPRPTIEYQARETEGGATRDIPFYGKQLPTNSFHHVVVTFDTNLDQLKAYVDGILQNSLTDHGPGGAKATTLNLGCHVSVDPGPSGCPESWVFDEFAIYPSALSEEVVNEHYRIGSAR